MRPKILILIEKVESELKKANDYAAKTKEAALEIAKSAAASPSQSGDREHSKNQAEIAAEYLKNLEVSRELLLSIEQNTPQKVQANVFVKLEYDDGQVQEYYLVKNPIKLSDLKIISKESPLGKSLLGLKIGDKFKVTDPPLSGKVLEIG